MSDLDPHRESRRKAGLKAAATVRQRKAAKRKSRLEAGRKAAATRRSPPYKAKVTAKRSQKVLFDWAMGNGWHVVFLDSAKGNPRNGIVDAVLVRIARGKPDVVQLRLVQLKGGLAGLKAREVTRLERAVTSVEVHALFALHDGARLTTMVDPRGWPAE